MGWTLSKLIKTYSLLKHVMGEQGSFEENRRGDESKAVQVTVRLALIRGAVWGCRGGEQRWCWGGGEDLHNSQRSSNY